MNVRNKQAQVGSGRARRATVAAHPCCCSCSWLAAAHAGPNEQAKRIYERIAGEPPPAAVLTQMAELRSAAPSASAGLARGRRRSRRSAPDFYNVTLKNMVIPWTNRDQTVFAPLNDYAATVIGMVRDDVDFNTALSADILYTVNDRGLPAPSTANNDHYATAETNGVDLLTALKHDHAVAGPTASRPRRPPA